MVGFNYLIAQTWAIGYINLQLFFLLFHVSVEQLLVGVQTGFSFCLTSLRCHTNPLQLTLQRFLALTLGFFFLCHTLRLLLQPTTVVALPRDTLATVQFQNPACHMIKEVSVVCHGNHCSLILLQMLFQPVDRLRIQVVGRLIEQQYIRLLQEQAAQRYTTAFATAQVITQLVSWRTTQGIHSYLQFGIQVPGIGSIDDVLQLSLTGHQLVHLVGVFIILRFSKLEVDFLIFLQSVHSLSRTFLHNFLHRLLRIQIRVLR